MADPKDNGTEYLDPTDSLYLRVQHISSAFLSFYEMLASNEPDKLEEIEEYFNKYPKAAQAKMRVAPIVLSKVLPARKQIQTVPAAPLKRLPPTKLVELGVGTDELKKLAGIDDSNGN